MLLTSPEGAVIGGISKAQVTIGRSGSRTGGRDTSDLVMADETFLALTVKTCPSQETAGRTTVTTVTTLRFWGDERFHPTVTLNTGPSSWRSCPSAQIRSSGPEEAASPGPQKVLPETKSGLSATTHKL